ncbi:MAG: general secretion pathway protein GspB [Candidatus Omnitrophica bacterium]|nr:general secretion pathway protein GspB [Candidatus Omnitrophota bacterium]
MLLKNKILFILYGIITFCIISSAFAEGAYEYDSKGNRDPFVPLISESGAYVSDAYAITGIKDVRLEGIVWDAARGSVAIINGEIVEEGQEIGSVKVIEIKDDSVIFDVGGEEVKVELRSE